MFSNCRKSTSLSAGQLGLTLVELMFALAIVGIISMFAVPSYREYSVRGKLPEARTHLVAKRLQMEQWFQDNRTYLNPNGLATWPCDVDTTSSQYFNFSCAAVAATTFTLQAVGKGPMGGFGFSIDQANAKTTTAVPAGWSAHVPNNCWVARKGGQC